MAVFEATEMYASPPTIDFDESKGIFVAEMMSRQQQIIIEGPDRSSVEHEIERTLHDEYVQMEADIARSRSQSRGRSMGGGGETDKRSADGIMTIGAGLAMSPDVEDDSRQKPNKNAKEHKMGAGTWVEMISGISAVIRGDWLSLALSGASLKLSGWMDDLSIFGSTKRIFSVSFGGILITATSRKELRKKLTKQKNKRIQRIMNNVKFAEKERENASVAGGSTKERLQNKKRKARVKRPNKWSVKLNREGRVLPQDRAQQMKDHLQDRKQLLKGKRAIARSMWVSRV